MALLLAGLPDSVPGTTINRLCGSGLDAVGMAARQIKTGEAELIIAGGVEIMSRAPFVMPKADDGLLAQRRDLRHHHRLALRQPGDEEAVRRRFHAGDRRERRRGIPGLARRPGRLRAPQPAARRRGAQDDGRLAQEIAPVTIKGRKGAETSSTPTSIRARRRWRRSRSCRRPFRDGGTVTAGNASGVNDGAAALLLASEAACAAARPEAARARARQGDRRRAAAHHGHRPGAGDAEASARGSA